MHLAEPAFDLLVLGAARLGSVQVVRALHEPACRPGAVHDLDARPARPGARIAAHGAAFLPGMVFLPVLAVGLGLAALRTAIGAGRRRPEKGGA